MNIVSTNRFFALCALASTAAIAEVQNISTTGLQSNSIEQTACTVVSSKDTPNIRGFRALVVFAESRGGGGNPKVRVASLDRNNRMVNSDWRVTVYRNGGALRPVDANNYYSKVLRPPRFNTDAALTFFAKPGERVCAFSLEEGRDGNAHMVNLSITDVTESYLESYGPNPRITAPHPSDVTSCESNFQSSFNENVSCDDIRTLPGSEHVIWGDGGGNGGDGGVGDGGDAGADGTGADGAPIRNAEIIFTDAEGRIIMTRTDSIGYFRINIGGMVAPITARIERSNNAWKSAMVEIVEKSPARTDFYTINLTGLSDAVLSSFAESSGVTGGSDAVTPSVLAANLGRLSGAISNVNNQIASQLYLNGLNPQTFNPLDMPFRANNTGYDKVLDSLVIRKTSFETTISLGNPPIEPIQCRNPSLISGSGCFTLYQPVCGCDGVTYPNSCVAKYENGIAFWDEGACPTGICEPRPENNYCDY